MSPVTVQTGRTRLSVRTRSRTTRLSWSRTIRKRRRTAPRRGHFRPAERLENDARIFERERRADDRRQRDRVARGHAAARRALMPSPASADRPGPGSRTTMPPRWMWLSGPHGPSGYTLPFAAPSSVGIGVDEEAGSATLLGRERFEAAIAVGDRVADERDLAAHVDAAGGQPVVVRRSARCRRRRPAR